jgi:hypothetical protein
MSDVIDNGNAKTGTTLHGLTTELSSGAKVFGSLSESGGVIWFFTDKDGVQTPLALSTEAMEAVCFIWQNLRGGAA